MDIELKNFIQALPKAELHLHIEGSFEPELIFSIAQRNKIKLKYSSVEVLKNAYQFTKLQEFLDIYYAGMSVLLAEQDFYDLTWEYLKKARANNILHTEIMFDPQAHTSRGISFGTVIKGITRAMKEAKEKLGISSFLIMSFLRHLSEKEAFKTLEESLEYKDQIIAVGLDSSEKGNPPEKFEKVFAKAREYGYLTVAHAGEEGPPEYIWGALGLLKVSRIDHGNSSLEDADLIETLAEEQVPLTVCPLSNLRLCVIKEMKNHPLKKMLDFGLKVTVNSDDPAYFGGYLNDNYIAVAEALHLSKADLMQLARNSFEASFLSEKEKALYLKIVGD